MKKTTLKFINFLLDIYPSLLLLYCASLAHYNDEDLIGNIAGVIGFICLLVVLVRVYRKHYF